jgi:hypothetical protein
MGHAPMTVIPSVLIARPRLHKHKWQRRKPERIVVFARMPSPTYDYYLRSRLEEAELPHVVVDMTEKALPALQAGGSFALFCRYADRKSLNWIEANAHELSGVGLFLDDDIAAWLADAEVPFGHKLYLLRYGVLPLRRLNRHLDRIWVSTAELGNALGGPSAVVLPPRPVPADFKPQATPRASGPIRIVFFAEYHSSEHQFLLPVVERVVAARPNVVFEVTESAAYAAQWRTLPRVTVSPFRPWPEFRSYTAQTGADIALVPLLPDPINRSRAPTKRIDLARLGAAGLFSDASCFAAGANAEEIFLPHDQTAWTDAILRLADDAELRRRAADATRDVVERLAATPSSIPGLT